MQKSSFTFNTNFLVLTTASSHPKRFGFPTFTASTENPLSRLKLWWPTEHLNEVMLLIWEFYRWVNSPLQKRNVVLKLNKVLKEKQKT